MELRLDANEVWSYQDLKEIMNAIESCGHKIEFTGVGAIQVTKGMKRTATQELTEIFEKAVPKEHKTMDYQTFKEEMKKIPQPFSKITAVQELGVSEDSFYRHLRKGKSENFIQKLKGRAKYIIVDQDRKEKFELREVTKDDKIKETREAIKEFQKKINGDNFRRSEYIDFMDYKGVSRTIAMEELHRMQQDDEVVYAEYGALKFAIKEMN